MKRSHVGLAAVGLTASFLLGSLAQSPLAAQQEPGGPGGPRGPRPPRFQISAFSGQTPQGVFHGCYTVDTATGELWVTAGDQPAKRVSEPLRKDGGGGGEPR